MLDENTPDGEQTTTTDTQTPAARRPRRAVSRPAGPPAGSTQDAGSSAPQTVVAADAAPPVEAPAEVGPPKKKTTTRKRVTKKAAAPPPASVPEAPAAEQADAEPASEKPAKKTTARKRTTKKTQSTKATDSTESTEADPGLFSATQSAASAPQDVATAPFVAPIFQAPDPVAPAPRRVEEPITDEADTAEDESDDEGGTPRRRRRRGGRRRRKGSGEGAEDEGAERPESADQATEKPEDESGDKSAEDGGTEESGQESSSTRRRRRRRRKGEEAAGAPDDPDNTVTRVRERRAAEDEITSVEGSTRLEAKKQRRREGREAGRRRAPLVTEAEFLARRESVQRDMVIRQRGDITQIAVLEDNVLVEHYVSREKQTSIIGNVYLGRVQNVLPSMEAAFIDIGKGRNAVLYAGEVDWKSLGGDNKPRRVEEVLKSGQTVLVQATKDPVGHKGARLTGQISLPGRFLVYVPNGQTSGISRKLPDTERNRLKGLLKEILPDDAGVIVRTAAEGATEEQLTRDVQALTARWEDISKKVEAGKAPQLLYGEPDLTIKVIRDLFNEDFASLVVDGDDAWDEVGAYVQHVAPDLAERLSRYEGPDDVFVNHRVDEQIAKGLDRKVFLPSGGSLVIDRTEAMTVVDVNTGKFTGSGGNLEETVTKNNLEAAEEVVRQLRLRDIGGIIVIDFIDMVLEQNRDLVLRRLVECLGRDRTRHQVAEVTSLGLVQMTRKRIGSGLLESFSETCDKCKGLGHVVHSEPVEPRKSEEDGGGRSSGRGGRGKGGAKSGAKSSGGKSSGKSSGGKSAPSDDGEQDEPSTGAKMKHDARVADPAHA